jgi:hypothetical protein
VAPLLEATLKSVVARNYKNIYPRFMITWDKKEFEKLASDGNLTEHFPKPAAMIKSLKEALDAYDDLFP